MRVVWCGQCGVWAKGQEVGVEMVVLLEGDGGNREEAEMAWSCASGARPGVSTHPRSKEARVGANTIS